MDITKRPDDTPPLHVSDGIASGNVYVALRADDGTITPGLIAGQRAVLQTEQGEKLELTTRAKIAAKPGAEGTYLNQIDFASFSERAHPTLRLYGWRDTFNKVRSSAGILLLLPALLALLTAAAGFFFLLSSQGQAPATAVAAQAQTIVTWATQPGTARTSRAQSCLSRIEGNPGPPVTVPGVSCVPPTTPWWRSTLTGSLVTGGIAILVALVGIFGLPSYYRFRSSPQPPVSTAGTPQA
jgi:hypothetical protein